MKETQVRLAWKDRLELSRHRAGVSLHSHTMHSRENLGFIPRYGAKVPVLAWELRRLARNHEARTGRAPDYTRGYWTPPLPGLQAYQLECRQIEEKLGLAALVSLTDHDDIQAGLQLRQREETRNVPISLEWTVPVGPTYFHLGVHNLPPAQAPAVLPSLAGYTRNPTHQARAELLEDLGRMPETLIVVNHPLWDQAGVGAERHRASLGELISSTNGSIHALELNGLRSWKENQAVMEAARHLQRPLVSGGDRHGCEPTAIINLTRAADFSEFAAEVRGGSSELAILDHYREPLQYRLLKSVYDIMREYPDLPGRARWSDRVFCQLYSGAIRSMSQVWNGNTPKVVRYFERSVRLAGHDQIQNLLRLSLANGHSPRLPSQV